MPKDPREEAQKQLNKAELYYDAEKYKNAAKYYNSAGDIYFNEHEFNIARENYYNAATSYVNIGDYNKAIGAFRNAGDCSLLIDDYSEAYSLFKRGIKYASNLKKNDQKEFIYYLLSSLTYLSLFPEGKQDLGLDIIKKIRKQVDDSSFKSSSFINLVKNFVIAIRDRKIDYLNKIENDFEKLDFNKTENRLLKHVLAIAKSQILIDVKISIDKEQYTTRDNINLNLTVDTKPLLDIIKNKAYNFQISKFIIENITLETSDNITTQKKPDYPIVMKPGDKIDLNFIVKPHFQLEDPYLGPISMDCKINDNITFIRKDKDVIKPNIISPPPSLEVSMKTLRPPLIDQVFPLEFLIENKSEGDALELQLNLEFPEELKVIRGTTLKQIYSLSSNDDIRWEISLKPLEPGDYVIKLDIKFKDPDRNEIEDIKEFPFSIKL